jgi:predicted esterase YcpF (UPF0227 family)
MIIYIHGFGSSGKGIKAQEFREYFKSINEPFIAPSLSYIPELAIETLEELIESYGKNVQLIGSSLGGYYAIYLAQKYNLKAVLINPAIFPYKTLARALGEALGFYDESHFQWMQTHLDMLKMYDIATPHKNNFMVLLQKDDEVLDYRQAADKFADANLIVQEGGNHSFENIQSYFQDIISFFYK